MIAVSIFALTGCGSSKKAVVKGKEAGTVEVVLPLSGQEYQSDKEYFRATASGKSPDIETAQKTAMINVKSKIAGLISSKIKEVSQNYTNQRSTENAIELEKKFESLTTDVVNQQLVDIAIKGEKLLKTGNIYEYWVGIEVSKQAILNGIDNTISKNQKLQIDYDKKKFEEIYNKEMEKMENGN